MKNEKGRNSKVILESINKVLRNKFKLKQWNNTAAVAAVMNLFKKIKNKNKYNFIRFNIKDFSSSISKNLIEDFVNFARQHIQIRREYFSIIQHTKKSLLSSMEVPWQKNNTNLFDVAIRAHHGVEVVEILDLFLSNNFGKNTAVWQNGFAVFKKINGHCADRVSK